MRVVDHDDDKGMEIYVSSLNKTVITQYVVPAILVSRVKLEILEKAGVPMKEQALCFREKKLADFCALKDYNLEQAQALKC